MILFSVAGSNASPGSDKASLVIAKGDGGFVVTQQDVENLSRFVAQYTPFETTPNEFRRFAVQTFLFAKEANRLGIKLPDSFQPLAPIHTQVALAEGYLNRVVRDYALDPVVIESYYKAHFEQFMAKGETSKPNEVIPEEVLVPLESAKETIQETLRAFVRQRIASQVFRDLVKRYHVSGDFPYED